MLIQPPLAANAKGVCCIFFSWAKVLARKTTLILAWQRMESFLPSRNWLNIYGEGELEAQAFLREPLSKLSTSLISARGVGSWWRVRWEVYDDKINDSWTCFVLGRGNGKPKPVSLNIEDEHGLWLWKRKCRLLCLDLWSLRFFTTSYDVPGFLWCEMKIEGVVEVLHHLFPHRFRDEEVSVQVGNAWNEMFGRLPKRTAATLEKIPGGFLPWNGRVYYETIQ